MRVWSRRKFVILFVEVVSLLRLLYARDQESFWKPGSINASLEADLIGIHHGNKFSPNTTLAPIQFGRDNGVCVTVSEPAELDRYKHLVSQLLHTKKVMDGSHFNVISLRNASFVAANHQNFRWGHAYNGSHYVQGLYEGWWRKPLKEEVKLKCQRTLDTGGNSVLFWHNHFSDNYCHFITDHLVIITWLIKLLPPGTKIALPDERYPRAYVAWWASLQPHVLWYNRGEVTCVEGELLAVDPPLKCLIEGSTWRMTALNSRFHEEALQLHSNTIPHTSALTRTVVLCSREDSRGGRRLGNEKQLAELIQKMMGEYGRREEFVIHHGKDKSLQEQFDVFNMASLMVGGAGSGMTNQMWTPWSSSKPDGDKVHVIEAICGTRSRIRSSCPYFRTHLLEFGAASWMAYHQVIYNASSTHATVWVDLDDVAEILDEVWGVSGELGPNTYCLPNI